MMLAMIMLVGVPWTINKSNALWLMVAMALKESSAEHITTICVIGMVMIYINRISNMHNPVNPRIGRIGVQTIESATGTLAELSTA